MSEDRRDNSEIYSRLNKVESDTKLVAQSLDQLRSAHDKMESEKIDPMAKKVDELHTTMTSSKGFIAGIFVMAGAVWSVILAVAAYLWKAFSGG